MFGSAALATARAFAISENNRRLRVGLLSDVHVSDARPARNLERALRYFDTRKVDAVLICGDLVTWARRYEYELMAATWFKVFPNDCRSDGTKIERLFLTGNHDVDGFSYGGARYKKLEEAKTDSFYFHQQEYWQEFFHEKYEPVFVKNVKGYTFVLRNWLSQPEPTPHFGQNFPKEKNRVGEFLASLDLPKDKPFFYAQHDMPLDTVNASWLVSGRYWGDGHDDGTSTKFLSKYPNVIAFSGHSHNSLTDEMSIWQGAFTAVNCSCNCGFAFTQPGRENGWSCDDFHRDPPFEMERFDILKVNQGLVMDVYDDVIVFERHDFRNAHKVGPDWVVPLGKRAEKPYTIAARVKAAKKPAFASDAKVTVTAGTGCGRDPSGTGRGKPHPQVYVSFPAVRTLDGSPVRAWDYAVRAEIAAGDVVKTLCERLVFSEGVFYSEEDETKPVVCAFNRKDLPAKMSKRQAVRFVVTPRSNWSVAGEPIVSDWLTVADLNGKKA